MRALITLLCCCAVAGCGQPANDVDFLDEVNSSAAMNDEEAAAAEEHAAAFKKQFAQNAAESFKRRTEMYERALRACKNFEQAGHSSPMCPPKKPELDTLEPPPE